MMSNSTYKNTLVIVLAASLGAAGWYWWKNKGRDQRNVPHPSRDDVKSRSKEAKEKVGEAAQTAKDYVAGEARDAKQAVSDKTSEIEDRAKGAWEGAKEGAQHGSSGLQEPKSKSSK